MHLLCILYFIYFNLHWLISSHRWHKHHIAPSKKKKIQVCVKKQANIQILNCRTVLLSVTDPLFDMWGTTNFVMRKADFTFTDKICEETENKRNKIKFYFAITWWWQIIIRRVCYLIPDLLCGVQDVPKKWIDCRVGHQDINSPTLFQSLFLNTNCPILRFCTRLFPGSLIIVVQHPKHVRENSPPVVTRAKNTRRLNEFFSVLPPANITGGPCHLDALALEQSHGSLHIGLPPAAHHHVGSSLAQCLRCSQADSEEGQKRSITVTSIFCPWKRRS